MRSLCDMGISWRTVEWLRQREHDVIHLREIGWQRATDAQAMAKAADEGRVILTMDLGLGYLLAVSRQHTPSVILFRLGDERADTVNDRPAIVLDRCVPDLDAGAIISVGDRAIRPLHLPL